MGVGVGVASPLPPPLCHMNPKKVSARRRYFFCSFYLPTLDIVYSLMYTLRASSASSFLPRGVRSSILSYPT